MTYYSLDRSWSERFMPAVRQILGPLVLLPAAEHQDQLEASDLVILSVADLRIAVRVRRPGYADRYPHEFTIRYRRASGAKTEAEKIYDGFGDWLFYGHAGDDFGSIASWMVVDLHSWRAHVARWCAQGWRPEWNEQFNRDGVTSFLPFSVDDFRGEPNILIDASWLRVQEVAA